MSKMGAKSRKKKIVTFPVVRALCVIARIYVRMSAYLSLSLSFSDCVCV